MKMHHKMNHSQTTQRDAITLIEVIFSIGVMLIGLVGLVAIIPIAGQQSQDSILGHGRFEPGACRRSRICKTDAIWRTRRIRPVPATTGSTVTNFTTASVAPMCFDPMFASSTTIPAIAAEQWIQPIIVSVLQPVTHNILDDPSSDTSDAGYTPWPADQPRNGSRGFGSA